MAKFTVDSTANEKDAMLKAMKDMCNGLRIAEGREKDLTENIVNLEVTIDDYQKIEDYYGVTFEQIPDKFYFSGGQLTMLIDTYGDNVKGLKIMHKEKVKTKNKRDFTPVEVIGF